ncbi:chromosomal replication initiator protein DnaA [Candidatus Curtissbacteria bacterium]|nr:chromosomal replication initiator protein DnaA [Candidatus Curtissbacteria bacterium]
MSVEGQKKWSNILAVIKKQISPSTFKTWFSGSYVLEFKKGDKKNLLIVAFKNSFLREQIETRYSPLISQAAKRVTQAPLEIIFVVSQKNAQGAAKNGPLFSGVPQSVMAKNQPESLNGGFTFDNFVVGGTNNLAFLAAKNIVDNLGSLYNPVLIYGPTGVGKTHLIQAIGNAVCAKIGDLQIVYVSCERFTNEYIDSLRNKTQAFFRQKYRKVDLLLVDDIQFLAGKESTQDEFFFTFNELLLGGKQVVLACDRHPRELGKLKERLVGRFISGMAADIGLPDLEMKIAILKSKCQGRGLPLDEATTSFIAESCQGGARELEGILTSLSARIALSGGKLSPDEVQEFVKVIQPTAFVKPSKEAVISAVCHYFRVRTGDLCSPSRKQRLVLARQVLMYLLRKELKLPLGEIGEIVGGRDHSTIIYGIEKIQRVIIQDRLTYDEILRVESLFHQ